MIRGKEKVKGLLTMYRHTSSILQKRVQSCCSSSWA